MKSDNSGFTTLEIYLVLLVALIIGFTGWFVWHSKDAANKALNNAASSQTPTKTAIAKKTTTQGSALSKTPKSSSTMGSSSASSTSSSSSTNKASSSSSNKSTVTNPTIKITSPSNGATITGSTFTLSCSHTTPNGYKSAEAIIQNVGGTPYNSGFSQGASFEACSVQENANNFPNGYYKITFTVTDSQGKSATATSYFTIQH